jgi:hypothetical protein
LLGVFYGKQAKDKLIEECEDGRVRSDAKRQRQDGKRGEKRVAAELARAKTQIAPECFER